MNEKVFENTFTNNMGQTLKGGDDVIYAGKSYADTHVYPARFMGAWKYSNGNYRVVVKRYIDTVEYLYEGKYFTYSDLYKKLNVRYPRANWGTEEYKQQLAEYTKGAETISKLVKTVEHRVVRRFSDCASVLELNRVYKLA